MNRHFYTTLNLKWSFIPSDYFRVTSYYAQYLTLYFGTLLELASLEAQELTFI